MELNRNKACAPVRNSSLSPLISTSHPNNRPLRTDLIHLQAQRNIPIAILIVLLKHVRHALEAYARLHKQIEAHGVAPAAIVRLVQQRDEALRQAVAECDERFVEFGVRDGAAVVGVEAVEEAAPCREEAPEAARGWGVSVQ
jgi:hypothetical protein